MDIVRIIIALIFFNWHLLQFLIINFFTAEITTSSHLDESEVDAKEGGPSRRPASEAVAKVNLGGSGRGEEAEVGHSWQRLPPELLREILMRLEREEAWPERRCMVACATVCRSWRH
ncbi:Tubby-like F-box protein 6 [Acorus gramineus]|uniref:Tubby-like F-box protein 6 n=1 Tax=Acorus gramineus TaxID=55184 RepID=A0AAV9BCV4_ACOGR|nr:Tubby-like F-box protein 6 [Acorus gramineus]